MEVISITNVPPVMLLPFTSNDPDFKEIVPLCDPVTFLPNQVIVDFAASTVYVMGLPGFLKADNATTAANKRMEVIFNFIFFGLLVGHKDTL